MTAKERSIVKFGLVIIYLVVVFLLYTILPNLFQWGIGAVGYGITLVVYNSIKATPWQKITLSLLGGLCLAVMTFRYGFVIGVIVSTSYLILVWAFTQSND